MTLFRVSQNNKYGFVDKKGNEALPFIYDFACDFSEGLHGRLTSTIRLMPFTLSECEKYYRKNHFRLPIRLFQLCGTYERSNYIIK